MVWRKKLKGRSGTLFTAHPEDKITYSAISPVMHYVLNSSMEVIDSIQTTNGVFTDWHGVTFTKDDTYVLIGNRFEKMKKSDIDDSLGQDSIYMMVGYIQEFNEDKELIFEWRSIDHIDILDADTSNLVKLSAARTEHIHPNSIIEDLDGNLILSSKFLHELTKINSKTGEIMWRMGKGKGNQFSFINDPENGFTDQHDPNILPNGNLLLFDNGSFHSPPVTRAVEYKINEANKTAEMVWEFRPKEGYRIPAKGSVQRLENGNTLIGWGDESYFNNTGNIPVFTEVNKNGEVIVTAKINTPKISGSYRVKKYNY